MKEEYQINKEVLDKLYYFDFEYVAINQFQ